MAINNDRNLLEQQILSNSGLKGKELENLKARLATLSEQQLQAELSKSLSGNNKGEWYTGVMLEHNASVIMRNNHDQTSYTDDNGNEISELKDGDEVLERTIKSTDDKGNVFETTVTFSGGRPLTQTKTKNGNTTETTTYKYNDDADVPFVTVETKKADQSKVMTNVLEIDENGNFDNEDFIDRQTTSMDGTTTHIFTENNCVIEQQVKPNGKKIDTIYKGDSIEDYDNKKLHRVYQRTELKGEIHEVAYDGNGNTRTVVQNGESPSALAKKFGVKESSLRRLNPARGKNAITQVGADIVVPGEYDADARVMTRRKSKLGAMQDFANDEVQRTAQRLYSSTMQEVTLDKDYKDAYSYARALLAADGVKNPSNQQVNNKANEILVANGNIKFKKGTKVQIAAKAPDSKFVQDLSNNGFKPTRENAIFYNRFNALNPSQQQNVLSVIKYCRSQKITDPNKIKARILETFPEINLFDSGKLIPMNSSFGTPAFQRKNPVALETFLTETLKLDLKSDVGRQVYERLASLPQEELGKINGSNFGDLSKSNFNDIANRFESSGVNIRTQFENQIEQNSRAHRAERLGIPQQKFTSEMLANIYDRAADMMEEYYHNHGVFDAGTYLEGMKNLMDWITPDNLFGIDMRSTLHVASDCRKAAQRFRQMHTDNPETFKREYAQLKKDGLVTADYNQQNVQEFMNLIQSGDVDINSDKFKNACKKAFGFKGVENTEKYIQTGQMAGNIGDIAVMLYTLGAASELKMMGKATQGVYGALERGAGRIMSKTAAQKTAKIGTSMAMGGTTLGGFTLGKETLNNLSNPMRDATSWETWKETGIASAESFGFGAFGGLLNETIVAPVVKYIAKPGKQATQAVSRALSGNTELSGKEILQTATKAQNLNMSGLFKMNAVELKDFAQILGAHAAGFGVEVVGFAGYEAGLDAIKDICDPQTGRLPEDMTLANLTKYLGHKIGDQFSNLGTIKGISQLLMMSKGGKAAQNAMMNKMIADSEKLNDVKFKKVNQNGNEAIEMTLPDGSKKLVSSPDQAIQTCQTLMQMEFVVNNLKPEEETKPNPEEVKTEEDKAEPISEDKPETKTDSTEPIIEESNPKTGQEEISVPKEEKPKGQEVIEDSVPESELKPAEENQEQIINTEPKVKTETTEVINDKPVPANETEANPVIEEVKEQPKSETKTTEEIKTADEIEEELPVQLEEPVEKDKSAEINNPVDSENTTEKANEIKPETKLSANQKLSIEKATDADLRVIQEIDMEAFEGRYNIDSDFAAYKADLADQGITTYAIKGEDGNVIGYYQLEPVENGELYIHSIGVKKELRNSRTSYKALKQAQETITEIAKQQNLDKVVLDVDAGKPELVKLYKKFGFEIISENSGTEAGHQYHDYRMEADVKKVLAKDSTNVEPEKVDTKATDSVKQTEEIENKEEIVNDNVPKVEDKPFFEPRKEEGLRTIKINENNNFAVKIYEKDGKEFFKINDVEFEITFSNNGKDIAKQLWANQLYDEAGFSVDDMYLYNEGEKSGYVTRSTTKPFYAIEKLQKTYGINLFIDKIKIEQDGFSFNKNGEIIKLQIVKDGDVRLSDTSTKNNIVYITEDELLFTLERLANIPQTSVKNGSSAQYKYKRDKIPYSDEISQEFLKVYTEIKQQCDALKREQYAKNNLSSDNQYLNDLISREMQNVEISEWHQEDLENLLNENIEERYKEHQYLKEIYSSEQSYFQYMLARNPELKPYIAEIRHLINTDKDNRRYVYSYVNNTGYYVDIEPERAAATIKILKDMKGSTYSSERIENFKKLQYIPTRILCKLVFEDRITDVNQIEDTWNRFGITRGKQLKLSEYGELSEKVENDLLRTCMDEYGEIDNDKVALIKILLQKSPEFGKEYGSYSSGGPYSMIAEIARQVTNKYQYTDIIENILPMLEKNDIEYKSKYTNEDIKGLLACNPNERNTVIERIKKLRPDTSSFDYRLDRKKSTDKTRVKLYGEMKQEGFETYQINKILNNTNMYPFDIINLEAVEFSKSLQQFSDKGINVDHLRDAFVYQYLKYCETNNYEGKKEIVRKVQQVAELINDPIRAKEPLSVNNAVRLVDLPSDKYQQIHDIIFLKDADGFMIPFNDNNGEENLMKIINLMRDDVNVKHFHEDYLPLARKYQNSGLNYTYMIQDILNAEHKKYDGSIERKTDYSSAIKQLEYLLENSDNFRSNHGGCLRDAALLAPKQFNRLKQDLLNIESLGENQPYDSAKIDIAELSDADYAIFKNILMPRLSRLFKDQSINEGSNYSKLYDEYLKLSPAQLDKIADTIEFYTSNLDRLENGDRKAESKEISNLIHSKYESVLDVINIIGQEGMNNAIRYNYKGILQFLKDVDSLKKIDESTKSVISEQLEKLETSDQKLEKLSAIAGITTKVNNSELIDIVTSKKLDTICDSLNFFTDNVKKLEHADLDVTVDMVRKVILDNPKSVLDIIDITSETELKHALGMKYRGLKALLENTNSLSNLEPETRAILREQLAILPHPEQKLEKLSVVAALVGKIENNTLIDIIRGIKSPEMTMEQQELADRIFADSSASYETQIENFIKEFDVPESRQDLIRKFLLKQNLQTKFVTPPSFEKQLEIIDKKINTVVANDKIPQEKKEAYLDVLNKQKADLIANPDKYTRRRLNESVMKALAKQVESHINLPNNNRAFNKSVNRELYKLYNVENIDELLDADIQFDSKYFSKLFDGASSSSFKTQFKKLLDLIKANPNKNLSDILDTIPTNMETRKLFRENGLNYDRWIKYDENFNHRFEFVIDVDKSVKAAKDNLMLEFNSELAQKLDSQQIAALVKIAEDMDIQNAGQKDLPKIIKAIEVYMDKVEYWKDKNDPIIKEFRDHIKIHKKNIHDIESLRDTKEELFVRLWDEDDVGRNIFFGNHVGCCTSVGHGNSFAAPQHLMNSFVNGIEIVDKAGNSMGNSMCYFAKVDGKLTFVIDSFEANGKLGAAPEVTDAIIEFGKKVCAEMGQPDANVMFGPNYNKVNFDRCVKTSNHKIEVIGRAPEETYIDCTGGRSNINVVAENRSMHEIINL